MASAALVASNLAVVQTAGPVRAATVPSGFTATDFVGGFGDRLTTMAWAPDGRLFVCEKGGKLRVVKAGALLAQPFLSLNVNTVSERGLTGLAFDPSFATNRYLYIYYTSATTLKNRLSRFRASATQPDLVEPGSELILLDNIPSDSGMHNAGAIHFGPDGKLYVSVGDSGTGSNAQNLGILPGKILRLNSDGSVPIDNPFRGQAGRRPEIWAYGLRNPYTFAFQPGVGRMFINDVGGDRYEEINEGQRGGNFGWPTCEGPCSSTSFINPVYSYPHAAGSGAAITGGMFYSGSRFPAEYVGDYFFGDYVGHWIKRYDASTGQVSTFATDTRFVVDVKTGPDGALYWLSVEARKVGRIEYVGGSAPPPTPTPTPTPTPAPIGQTPMPVIDLPSGGTQYRAGQEMGFSGHATDAEDGNLAAGRLTWEVVFHHNDHTHPFMDATSGIASGSFVTGDTGETSADTWYRIHLRATDSNGNTREAVRDITPLTTTVTLTTAPSGLTVLLDGAPVVTPHSFTGVQGFKRELTAPATQVFAGTTYEFVEWSNGAPADQTYVTPDAPANVVATYSEVASPDPTQGTTFAADGFARTVSNGWGNADIGGAYSVPDSSGSFSVSTGMGHMVFPVAGSTRSALLASATARDVDLRARVQTDKKPMGGSQYAYLMARANGSSQYRPKITMSSDGSVAVHASVVVNGTESSLGSAVTVPALAGAATSPIWLRAQITGANPTTIRVKAWRDGEAEPAGWQFSAQNSVAGLQVAGGVGLRGYINSSNTNAPVRFSFDAFSASVFATTSPSSATDSFSRTVSGGWGLANVGGAYSLEGKATNFSVSAGLGRITVASGGVTRAAVLPEVGLRDAAIKFRVELDRLPTGGPMYVYGIARRSANSAYQPKLIIRPNGAVEVHAGVVVNGAESSLAPAVSVPNLVYAPGGWLWVRIEVVGTNPTTIRIKTWSAAASEPSGWRFTATNNAAVLQGSGAVGLRSAASSGVRNAPITVSFDDFVAGPAGP